MVDLKALRKKLGINQYELGQLIGVHGSQVSKAERKICGLPPYQTNLLQKLNDCDTKGINVRREIATRGAVNTFFILIKL